MTRTPVAITALVDPRPATAPEYFHVLAKPSGPICNLDREYCFFLSKEALYPGDRFRMTDEVLEAYVRQLLEAHASAPEVTVAWQGGEPTLLTAWGPGSCSSSPSWSATTTPGSGHVDGPMRMMADLLRQGRYADEIMAIFAHAERNDPCPCGSGRKAKLGHPR